MISLKNQRDNGSIIVSILFVTIFLTTVIYALLVLANSNIYRSKSRIYNLQAQYSAESGADAAIAMLNSGNIAYTGTNGAEITVLTNGNLYRSTYSVTVVAGADAKEKIITAVGKVYTPTSSNQAQYTRTIEVVAQRSSTMTSTAMVSRNIIDIQSGVKNIQAKDVYVNGYINMNKNTTNLIAENITVADKNTGASNCSIGGTGNLLKPSVFTNPGQTKTNLTLAFNNCINPPGNNSNADFNVSTNQGISKLQSTYIPWFEYMDNSYQNSVNNCSDWTSGPFPRDIPSTGNSKKTHYPDSGNNVSTACGTSGNLNLTSGQYNIKDHVHLRANLCGSAGCNVTFKNPDPTIKYVFVEGTINFSNLITTADSGPIVFISYGADPAALTSLCPLGGAVYLGTAGSAQTDAPDAYLLSTNGGVCIDKTKFGSDKALGGLSGKNLFIASSTGTPFDLALDPIFPVNEIPVDLFWRAYRYRRL